MHLKAHHFAHHLKFFGLIIIRSETIDLWQFLFVFLVEALERIKFARMYFDKYLTKTLTLCLLTLL